MNNRKLYESIMNRIAKVVKEQLNEGYMSMSSKDAENDVKWLSSKYCSGRSYIQSLFDPVQNYAIYGITKDQADILKERMKHLNVFLGLVQ